MLGISRQQLSPEILKLQRMNLVKTHYGVILRGIREVRDAFLTGTTLDGR
jgi:hypothetical protein